MPIRPENRKRYPANWAEISRRIREERAGGRCECQGQCGFDHGDETDEMEPSDLSPPLERCQAWNGERHPITDSVVVLTVMHLDHTPEHCDDDNLLAGCQRCHLRYDRGHHADTRRSRKAIRDLFAELD